MKTYKPVETELGFISGRDAIYVYDIHYDYNRRTVTLQGEFNGLLCSDISSEEFIAYEMIFEDVYVFKSIELDVCLELMDTEEVTYCSIGEYTESDLLETIKKARNVHLKHYVIQTYDDVFVIACKHLKLTLVQQA
ncbi:hypothetical protein LQV63_16130 [Paenibacillus profundus]|uniref:Uncharacterized protein n=1 Tax=Paenibacillus profundus TaxID=1173085 RepID=A0ABS8YI58_9BACL|nr:hypothetical protein [Paenibacillus profundus]MCE5170832.1 hypothetical protein [Paenibacillus profundus]